MPDLYQLLQKQSLSLEAKVRMAMMRIRAWYLHWEGEVHWKLEGTLPGIALRLLVVDDCALDIEDPAPGGKICNQIVPFVVGDDPCLIENWLEYGCNAFEAEPPQCRPLSIWTEEDLTNFVRNR